MAGDGFFYPLPVPYGTGPGELRPASLSLIGQIREIQDKLIFTNYLSALIIITPGRVRLINKDTFLASFAFCRIAHFAKLSAGSLDLAQDKSCGRPGRRSNEGYLIEIGCVKCEALPSYITVTHDSIKVPRT